MNYQTRKFILLGDRQKTLANAAITHAPLGLEVIIREPVKSRNNEQNALYWAILGEISEQAWIHGKQYNSDVMHEYCKREVMPEEITTKDGEVRSKWLESPNGQPVVISTTLLSKKCFAEYIYWVQALGAGLGVRFSA